MDWAHSIKQFRSKTLLTHDELAKKLEVSFVSVNRLKNGEHKPSMKVRRQLMALIKKYVIVEE